LPQQFAGVHLPYTSMWIPPLVLGVLGVIFGCAPGITGHLLTEQVAKNIIHHEITAPLKIYHGFNQVLILSLLTLAVGTLVYLINKASSRKLAFIARFKALSPEQIIVGCGEDLLKISAWATSLSHNGYLRSYHLKIILFAEALLAYKLWHSGSISIDLNMLTQPGLYEIAVALVFVGALGIMVSTSSRLTAVVSMSIIGYCTCLIFVFYSAPDLAMTQFTIDTLSTVLFVLVLYRLPSFMNLASRKILYRDAVISIGFGLILSLIALKIWSEPITKDISHFYG